MQNWLRQKTAFPFSLWFKTDPPRPIWLHPIQFTSRSVLKFELNVNSVVNLCTPAYNNMSASHPHPSLRLGKRHVCCATLNRCWRLSIYTGICRYSDKITLSHLFTSFHRHSFTLLYVCSHVLSFIFFHISSSDSFMLLDVWNGWANSVLG